GDEVRRRAGRSTRTGLLLGLGARDIGAPVARDSRSGRRRDAMTPRRTRGFTLTEVLLSLALLSILVLGVFGWTTTSARTTAALVGPAAWRASVEALRRAIQWDVFVADLREDRIKVDGNILRIRTRDQGVATHAYTI